MEESHLLATTAVDGEDVWIENIHPCPDKETAPDDLEETQRAEKAPTSKWENFLRAMSPRIITAWIMSLNGRREPKKVAIQHGYLYAFLGASVHIIPVSGVVFIVGLNLRGRLFGIVQDYSDTSSDWIPAFQYGAKLHDLFMLASLASLVYSVMSSELCLRNGLPYGALFSGLQVSQPSFLWSQEMWGLLTSKELPRLVLLKMSLTIVVAIILGLAVGPASAALMIPRVRTTLVGSTPFWLNATESDLFPSELEGNMVRSFCANTSGLPSQNLCPSSGWEELVGLASVSATGRDEFRWDQIFFPDSFVDGLHVNVTELPGLYTKRSMYSAYGDEFGPNNFSYSNVATTQNAPLAETLFVVDQMWTRINMRSTKAYIASTPFHTLNASQPYAAVHCADDSEIDGADDARPLPFEADSGIIYNLTTMNRSELLQSQDNTSNSELVFVDLSQINSLAGDLEDVYLGAVILSGQQSFSSCIVHSGWASSFLNISYHSRTIESSGDVRFLKSRSVKISPSWAKFLNPIIDAAGARVFESLSTYFGADQNLTANKFTYQEILAALVTNGLANIGMDTNLQGDLAESASCALGLWEGLAHCDHSNPLTSNPDYFVKPAGAETEDWTEWQTKHFVHGLAYSSDGTIIKVSIVVLLIYATVASVHSVYTIWRGNSSSSWQSVSELMTLALVSQPPLDPDLQNTTAGIYGLGAFKKNVRVVAVDGEKAAQKCREELQLVFGKKMPAGFKKLEPNEEYGATQ